MSNGKNKNRKKSANFGPRYGGDKPQPTVETVRPLVAIIDEEAGEVALELTGVDDPRQDILVSHEDKIISQQLSENYELRKTAAKAERVAAMRAELQNLQGSTLLAKKTEIRVLEKEIADELAAYVDEDRLDTITDYAVEDAGVIFTDRDKGMSELEAYEQKVKNDIANKRLAAEYIIDLTEPTSLPVANDVVPRIADNSAPVVHAPETMAYLSLEPALPDRWSPDSTNTSMEDDAPNINDIKKEVRKLRELAIRAGKDLDDLIAGYRAETEPAKADILWDRLQRANKVYQELVADFNLKNEGLSDLIRTPLFKAMKEPAELKIAKATIRSEEHFRNEDASYLHIPPTREDLKADEEAAKRSAKEQRRHDLSTLSKAVKEIPAWFSPDGDSSGSSREKQWSKVLKSFRDESRKYSKHERGDALTSTYRIARKLENKWRGRDDFDSLTVIEKEEYHKDMDQLLHDHDAFVWKVLGANKIDARDLSISDLYHVISRAEFKDTLRKSRGFELGGFASMLVSAPSELYLTSMALVTSFFPGTDNLHWFIGSISRQRTIDSLSNRTAKGLGIPIHAEEYTTAA